MPVRLALVDDHALVREGLSLVLAREPDFEVVGQASNAAEVAELVARELPDVVLVDLAMPGVSGFTVCAEIRARHPKTAVLVVSQHREDEYIAQALEAGARGYVLKDKPPSQLVEAVRTVARGEAFFSPEVSQFVLSAYLQRNQRSDMPSALAALSPRERETLHLLVQGSSNDEIGRALGISGKTVQTHRAALLKKLDLHSMVELMRFAARHGLITH